MKTQTGCFCVILIIAASVVHFDTKDAVAQTESVQLPHTFVDFAIDPETGTVCAVTQNDEKAFLIKPEFFDGDKGAISDPISIGAQPARVVFKRYRGKAFFVACCYKDSNLYVIDATTGKLVKKVPVLEAGVQSLAASTNDSDPFVLYCFGAGHGSSTGALDLREFRDVGKVFGDSATASISADGTIAYRRGPWSPTGFESLTRTTAIDDPNPKFVRLFYDHRSTLPYLPGPFGEYTASGNTLYSADLKRKVATLDSNVVFFHPDRPLLFCINGNNTTGRSDSSLKITAYSYNTFKRVGASVSLSARRASSPPSRPQSRRQVVNYRRVFADPQAKRLYVLRNNWATLIPFDQFELPDEAYLRVDVDQKRATVGEAVEISLKKMDPRVEIDFEDLPAGVEKTERGLRWTPSADQVGTEKIVLNLKHGEVQRQQVLPIDVAFPSVQLGHSASRVAVGPKKDVAVVWHQPNRNFRSPNETLPKNILTIIDLTARKVTATRDLPFKILTASVDSHFVYVASAESSYVQVLSKTDLTKKKTIYADKQVSQISSDDQILKIGNRQYQLPSLDRVKRNKSVISLNDLLRTIPRYQQSNGQRSFPMPNRSGNVFSRSPEMPATFAARDDIRNRSTLAQTKLLEPSGIPIRAFVTRKQQQVSGAIHTSERLIEIGIEVLDPDRRGVQIRQKLMSVVRPIVPNRSTDDAPVSVEARGDDAYIVCNDRLFHWNPSFLGDRSNDVTPIFRADSVVPQAIPESGKLDIQLSAKGGESPIEFELPGEIPGIRLSDNGLCQVDCEKIRTLAEEYLTNFLSRQNPNGDEQISKETADHLNRMAEAVAQSTKKEFEGWPVNFTFVVRAIDSESQKSVTSVSLVVPANRDTIAKNLEAARAKVREQMEKQRRLAEERKKRQMDQNGAADLKKEVVQLRQKVESLEARLDLLTRQLAEIIKEKK